MLYIYIIKEPYLIIFIINPFLFHSFYKLHTQHIFISHETQFSPGKNSLQTSSCLILEIFLFITNQIV